MIRFNCMRRSHSTVIVKGLQIDEIWVHPLRTRFVSIWDSYKDGNDERPPYKHPNSWNPCDHR
jgi:hypothetical protein